MLSVPSLQTVGIIDGCARIGNSVVPQVAAAIVRANLSAQGDQEKVA